MADSIILKENVSIEEKLHVVSDFDVNDTVLIAAATGNVTGLGSIGCGAVNSSAAVTGTSVTDGTVSLAGDGTITGVSSINASGTLTGGTVTDGTASMTAGEITGLTSLDVSGALSGTSVSDGTVSLAGDGTITGVSSINASGTLTGGTVTDGTFSVNSGAITGATSIGCTSIVCTGTIQGDVDLDQLKANSAVSLNKDGTTWTELSTITGSSGCYILQVRAHTDDNANSVWICTSDGTTGSCSRLASSAGSTSSVKIQARWQAATSIEVKFESSWGGGVGVISAYAVSLFPAA